MGVLEVPLVVLAAYVGNGGGKPEEVSPDGDPEESKGVMQTNGGAPGEAEAMNPSDAGNIGDKVRNGFTSSGSALEVQPRCLSIVTQRQRRIPGRN